MASLLITGDPLAFDTTSPSKTSVRARLDTTERLCVSVNMLEVAQMSVEVGVTRTDIKKGLQKYSHSAHTYTEPLCLVLCNLKDTSYKF